MWKVVRKCNPNNFLRLVTEPQFIAGAISIDIDDKAWSSISITPLKWIASDILHRSKAGEKDVMCLDVLTVAISYVSIDEQERFVLVGNKSHIT
jgi:hypothetical protein